MVRHLAIYLLMVLGLALAGCGPTDLLSGPEPTKTEYEATEEAHAARAHLDRNPLAGDGNHHAPPARGQPSLTGDLYVVAYPDRRSSSVFLQGGIDGSHTGDCSGVDAYKDLREGASVTVSDGAGRVLTRGTLGRGKGGTLSGGEPGSDLERLGQDALTCTFPFRLENLPQASEYNIEVADRGVVSFSEAKLEQPGRVVALSVSPFPLSVYATPSP